jgi:hypothetical protein
MTIAAATVVTSMWRGTEFILTVHAKDEDDNPEGMSGYTPYLQIDMPSGSSTEIEGTVTNADYGYMEFVIPDSVTTDFISGGTDFTVLVEKDGDRWPILRSRLGVMGWDKAGRTVDHLVRLIREEIRAEGPDGNGISDFLLVSAMNAAIDDLSDVFPIRDTVEFTTTEGVNHYDLADEVESAIYDIIKVEYDDTLISGTQVSDYLNKTVRTEGSVDEWLLWGTSFILLGEVEDDKTVKMWVSRAPLPLKEKDDEPETPRYADEAIKAYAISTAYRESRDYGRADYHYGIYLRQKSNLLKRAVPQGQKDKLPKMRDSYWGPFRGQSVVHTRFSDEED